MHQIYKEHISGFEVGVYFAIWIGSISLSCLAVRIASIDFKHQLTGEFLEEGWLPGNYLKDTQDFEWSFWTLWARALWPWLLGHLILSRIVPRKYHSIVMSLYSFVVISAVLGYKFSLILLSHFLVIYVATWFKSSIVIWIASLGLLSLLNVKSSMDYLHKECTEHGMDSNGFYLAQLILSIKNLHYTSYALDYVQSLQSGDKHKTCSFSFLNMLHYVMYLPLFFTGPFLGYARFIQQHKEPVYQPVRTSIKEALRLAFWVLFCEVCLHFFYFGSLQNNRDVLHNLAPWAVAGTAYCVGQFFMVKYVVLYGLPSLCAKLDGLTPPGQPQCIATIYFYSEMWKCFDKGLYSFVKDYIYVPLGGSRSGKCRQISASFCCFVFIFLWHGAEHYLFVWSFMNFIGIAVETIGISFFRIPVISEAINSYISVSWKCRLQAVLAVPLYMFYMTTIFVFLCGSASCGFSYAHRLLLAGWPTCTITLFIACYGCVHTSNYLAERKRAKKLKEM